MGIKKSRRGWVSALEQLEFRRLLSTIYVDAGATGSAHDGASWATAFTDLQSALTIANSGDQVDIAGGTYKPTNGTDRTVSFTPASGLAMYGGYAGAASSNPNTRDPAQYPTILSGDIGTAGSKIDNSYHVLQTGFITLDGLTITGGNANDGATGGGAVYSTGTMAAHNCSFIADSAQGDNGISGGAVDMVGNEPYGTFTDCNFDANSAIGGANGTGDGGAIAAQHDATFIDCSFVGNSSDFGSAIYGGSNVEVMNCTLVNNSTARGFGPCWYCTINDSIIWGDSELEDANSTSSAGNSDTDAPYVGSSLQSDPQFIRNPSPGADDVWGTPDDDFGDLELQQTSPCIGAASDGTDIGAFPYDPNVNVSVGGPYQVVQGQSIVLNGEASSKIPMTLQYGWDWTGNGQYMDSAVLDPTFSATLQTSVGTRNVSLRVTGSDGEVVTESTTITVSAPTIQALPGGPYTVTQGQSIALNGSGLTNVTGTLNYAWDFTSNGQFTDATVANPTFTTTPQTSVGQHTIQLRVTNADGQSDVESATVDVIAATLQASAGGPYAVVEGKTITLAGSASTNVSGSLQYAWDFNGDGQFDDATGANPIFSAVNITAPVSMQVSVEVTNALGQTSIAITTVNVEGPILYVDSHAPGADNGLDWKDAFTTLTAALNQAAQGQAIRVAVGTYHPTTTSDATATFNLMDGVSIEGGYAGFGAIDPDVQRLGSFMTVLSGQLVGGSSYHVVTADGVDNTAVLENVTIENGQATGNGNDADGGGVFISNGSPTLQDCYIFNNEANMDGAGIYDLDSSPHLIDCTIEDNTADAAGGGIANENSSPTMTDCSIGYNTVSGSSGGVPGGGGMADLDSSSPVVTGADFYVNRAGDGGAVYNSGDSNPTFTLCLFSSNAASGTNSDGGAFFDDDSSPSLIHCTIAGNAAATSGGAMFNINGSAAKLDDCIVWGDSGAGEIVGLSSQSTVVYSDVDGGIVGTGNINSNPKFVANPSPGPDGVIGTKDDYTGNFELLAGSPAIGTGDGNGGLYEMGRDVYNTDPHVYKPSVTDQSAKHKKTIEIMAQVIASSPDDPVKTVSVYDDTNGDGTFDAGDMLVGKAHQIKDGWEATIPVDKLPLGESTCYIIAEAKDGKKGEDSAGVDAKFITTASVKKVSAKYKATKGKSSGTLEIAASIKSGPITQIVFAIDTNDDGKLDSGDEVLYTGDGQSTKWKGAFDAIVGDSYSVLAKVRDVNGVWSNTSITSFKPS